MTDLTALAEGLTEAQRAELATLVRPLTSRQRLAIKRCGDVADRMPCRFCGADRASRCTISLWDRTVASDTANDAGPIVQGSGLVALRLHLLKGNGDADA